MWQQSSPMNHVAPLARARSEHVPLKVFPSNVGASSAIAAEMASLVRVRQREGRPAVLGLAAGSSPVGPYAERVRLHREDRLSFRNVISQKDQALFPGDDWREFWQRRENRCRHLAEPCNQPGLAEYEAIEAFKRYAPKEFLRHVQL